MNEFWFQVNRAMDALLLAALLLNTCACIVVFAIFPDPDALLYLPPALWVGIMVAADIWEDRDEWLQRMKTPEHEGGNHVASDQ